MLSNTWLSRNAQCWDHCLSYVDIDDKLEAHRMAVRLLRHFAKNVLCLSSVSYSVRSCVAGVAVSGEVTLHTEPFNNHRGLYLQIGQSACNIGNILFRACDNRADYVGYTNHFSSVTAAFGSNERIAFFVDIVRDICSQQYRSRY
jgi:hypothetical protein